MGTIVAQDAAAKTRADAAINLKTVFTFLPHLSELMEPAGKPAVPTLPGGRHSMR
jgi:hypothetical protein